METLIQLLLLIAIILCLSGFVFVLVICFMQIKALEYLFKTFILVDQEPTDQYDIDLVPRNQASTPINRPLSKNIDPINPEDRDQYTPLDAPGQDLPITKFRPDPKRPIKVNIVEREDE